MKSSFNFGLLIFLFVVLGLSFMACLDFEPVTKIFVAGEIATQDVAAEQDITLEDRESSNLKRNQVAERQPPVFDLSQDSFENLRKNTLDILKSVKSAEGEDVEKVRWQISEELNTEIGREIVTLWRQNDFQEFFQNQALPWVRSYYEKGVAAHGGILQQYKQGILINDMGSGMQTLQLDPASVHDLEQLKEGLEQYLKTDLKRSFRVRKAAISLIFPFLTANLIFNPEATSARKKEVMAAVEPAYHHIKKGEMIVRQGERVGPEQQQKLQSVFSQRNRLLQYYKAAGIFIVGLLFIAGLNLSMGRRGICCLSERDWMFLALVMLLFGLLAKFEEALRVPWSASGDVLRGHFSAFSLPIAGAAGVTALFFRKTTCFFMCMFMAFLICQIVGGGVNLFCFYVIGSIFYVYLIKGSETRVQVLKSVLPLSGSLLVMWLSISLMDYHGLAAMGMGALFVALNAILSLLIILGLSPIMEIIFGFTSRFKLMELMNLEQPLLRDLMVNAPGTYHHSIIVANMVEAGARVIGANALLAKVAALYHDIGKLKNPQYFIENLYGKENRHDRLTPSMSALILISHVKKGVELAREHGLGPQLTDLIRQHHGTTLIAFFYHKAQEQAEAKGEDPVREDEFRYPGPKPQTKEAGLILLADAIEASSRTLVDPSPSRIKNHIQSIVRKIYTEGELDESELTLRDMTQVSETFHRILTGIFHQRIEYPNLDKTSQAKPKELAAPLKVEDKNAA